MWTVRENPPKTLDAFKACCTRSTLCVWEWTWRDWDDSPIRSSLPPSIHYTWLCSQAQVDVISSSGVCSSSAPAVFFPTQLNNLRLHLGRRDRTRAVSVQLASPQQCDGTECTPVRIAQDPGVSSCTRDGCSLQMVNIRAYSTAQLLSCGAVSKKSHKVLAKDVEGSFPIDADD